MQTNTPIFQLAHLGSWKVSFRLVILREEESTFVSLAIGAQIIARQLEQGLDHLLVFGGTVLLASTRHSR